MAAYGQDLIPGDRVEALGHFGKPTGEFGTVNRMKMPSSRGTTMAAFAFTNHRSRKSSWQCLQFPQPSPA